MTRKEQIAWAAGFYEGEGHITYSHSPRDRVFRIAVTNTDLEVLERFKSIVNVGAIRPLSGTSRGKVRKPCYTWSVANAADVFLVIDLLFDHLSTRRQDQILNAVQRREETRAQRVA